MLWKVRISFNDGEVLEDDEVFDTEAEATEYGYQMLSDCHQGGSYLAEAGEDYDSCDDGEIDTY